MLLKIDPQTAENMLICIVDEQNSIQAMATNPETAKLIEAAPHLYEVCGWMLDHLSGSSDTRPTAGDLQRLIRRAMDKAK